MHIVYTRTHVLTTCDRIIDDESPGAASLSHAPAYLLNYHHRKLSGPARATKRTVRVVYFVFAPVYYTLENPVEYTMAHALMRDDVFVCVYVLDMCGCPCTSNGPLYARERMPCFHHHIIYSMYII